MSDWIGQLCDHVGIGPHYAGFHGEHIAVSSETRVAVLAAMGFEAETDADARAILHDLRQDASEHPAQPEIIVEAEQPQTVLLSRPAEWVLHGEDGSGVLASGSDRERIVLPPLPLGIHRLVMTTRADASLREWTVWVLARPLQAVSLAERTGAAKVWGVTTSVYGLTDLGAAPIGSYRLLADYAAEMAAHGADFVGVNPVHAMGDLRPDDVISPYSPSHRGFLNTWHISQPTGRPAGSDLIDYRAALASSNEALVAEFAAFMALPVEDAARRECEAFATARGDELDGYALFEALAARFGADWRTWPAAYRDHDGAALAAFAHENAEAVAFHKWAQWRADCELGQAQLRAGDVGMRIGLYLDLAVGPRLGGAETWAKGSSLVTGASLGAPPDPLAPSGQRWGLAPQSPHLCRAQGYAGFARLMRAVMRHAGMIRIDHILGLMRSFWVPDGGEEGAYVSYPLDALLAVVAIESARSGTVVIGEDLGLVPEGLREKLATSGIYGLEVLQYMRTDAGGFEDTAQARAKALCVFATHDTPTITGFFAGEDARLQSEIGALDPTGLQAIRDDRQKAQQTLGDKPIVAAIHDRLAGARSELVAVQLDDIAGRVNQQNLPGTIDQYPNWRQTAPFAVADIRKSPAFAQLGAEMRRNGRSNACANITENSPDNGDGS